MEEFKTLFYSSKFLWARERMFSKRTANLGTRPKKKFARPGLDPPDFDLLRFPLQSSKRSVQTNADTDKHL